MRRVRHRETNEILGQIMKDLDLRTKEFVTPFGGNNKPSNHLSKRMTWQDM